MNMSTVEIETGRYITRWAFWNPATWSIPKLYWDAWSQEQRLHAICRQLEKVIKYADYIGVNVDDIAARLKAIEEGQIDEIIVAAVEAWFEEHASDITGRIDTLEDEMSTANDDISNLKDDVLANSNAIETIQTELEELQVSDVLQSIGTIETMEIVFRAFNFDTFTVNEDMQGGVYYPQGNSNFFSFVTGTDESRKLRTVNVNAWNVFSDIALPEGHYGVISVDVENNELFIPAYRDTWPNYGTIYVYDITDPTAIVLKRLETFDTTYGVQALVFKSPGVYLIEGNPSGVQDVNEWSGIYEYNYSENTYTFLFDMNRKKNGERSQPFIYDAIREMVVAPTVDNAGMTWYDLDGNEFATINLRSEYNFMSFGEYENLTVEEGSLFIGSYYRAPMNESRSFQLWKFDLATKNGKNMSYVDMPSAVYTVTADYVNGDIVPNVASNSNPSVKFPNDAINIARHMSDDSGLNVTLAFAGNYPCGLYVNGYNGQVSLAAGTFARGIVFYNSRIVVTDVTTDQFEEADENSSLLSSRTYGSWSRASALSKPAYISFINTQAIIELVRSMASITLSNIYTFRFVASDIIVNSSNIKNAVTQYSGIRWITAAPAFDVTENSIVQG